MIYEVEGDILLSSAHAIAHGVAPNDDFKNGLALALRERWPAMYKNFRHYCHTSGARVGHSWATLAGDKYIVALFTQEPPAADGERPGRAKLSSVNQALRDLRKFIVREHVRSVALPRLATGVGELDWEDVKPLIEAHLGDLDIPVYVYAVFHPGVVADEPA